MKNVGLSSTACFLAVALATATPVTMSAQSGGGTIEGHVKLTGTPPPNPPIKMGADPSCLKINAGKRVLLETVLKAAEGGLANVFVDVKGSFPESPAPSTSVVIDQRGCVYHPRVLGARVGQTLEVKNSERLNVWEALQQAEANAKTCPALLFFKRAHSDLYVALRAEEFLKLLPCPVNAPPSRRNPPTPP